MILESEPSSRMDSNSSHPSFDSIPSCISAFSRGDFIIVLDSEHRENEADLIIAAQDLTPEKMAFMIRYSSGLVCAPLTPQRAKLLDLPQMVNENTDPNRTAYTISIDAVSEGVTTGISAADRATTCRVLARDSATSSDLRRPGHIFPLRAREGGVRQRQGHTEAAVDFCRLAGKAEVAAICEMVEDGVETFDQEGRLRAERADGGMMRRDSALSFGRRWGLKVCTIEKLVEYMNETKGADGPHLNGITNGVGEVGKV